MLGCIVRSFNAPISDFGGGICGVLLQFSRFSVDPIPIAVFTFSNGISQADEGPFRSDLSFELSAKFVLSDPASDTRDPDIGHEKAAVEVIPGTDDSHALRNWPPPAAFGCRRKVGRLRQRRFCQVCRSRSCRIRRHFRTTRGTPTRVRARSSLPSRSSK